MEEKKQNIGDEIELFTKHIDSIGDVLISMIMVLQEISKKSKESLNKFEGEKCEVTESGSEREVKIPNEHYWKWNKLDRRYEHVELARELLPRSLLVSLVSQYDAYLGRVLRFIFLNKPEILNGSERKISFEDLNQFTSIAEAREYILEKEIEAILRYSHGEQFKWMEKAFNLPLTKELKNWGRFIEITERRNLFVHTDGVVSSQYLTVCFQHKYKIDDSIKEGTRLAVPQKYFESAYECIYEIGVKLGHVLWRKLYPDERSLADAALQRTTDELIDSGKYRLAYNLLDFACEFKKFSSESNQLILTVNRAQAYKWAGEEERCKEIMCAVDWSAKGNQFKLADAVLARDWDRAAEVMKRIGHQGSVSKQDYREWPLFKEWRKEERFLAIYEEVFGESFAVKIGTKPHQEELIVAESSDSKVTEETVIDEAL